VSAEPHVAVTQSLLVLLTGTLAQIRLPVLEFTSPTCTCSMSIANVLNSRRTVCTVTRLSKSTLHHWFVPYAVIENVELLLSLAIHAGFKKSKIPTATSVVNVLDCVATHALLRIPPQDRAKLS
jgi:hypothetical protein